MKRRDLMLATYRFEDPETGRPLPFANGGKPVIYLISRDANRKRCNTKIWNFRPHCWVADENGDERDIFGRPIKHIIYDNPKATRKLRSKYPYHAEADIPFWLRYLIDKKILCGYRVVDNDVEPAPDLGVPPLILYFDIEVEAPPQILPRASDPRWPIVSFQFSNNYDDRIDVFLLDCKTPQGKISEVVGDTFEYTAKHRYGEDQIVAHLHYFDNEARMIHEAANYVANLDPDIPTGWNSSLFDLPYWIRRARYLRVPVTKLSPFNKVEVVKRRGGRVREEAFIKGRDPVDMLAAYQKWSTGKQPIVKGRPFGVTYDFKIVVEYETGFKYEDLGDRVEEVRHNTPKEWVKYCVLDAYALRLLDRVTGLYQHFDRLRRIYGVPLSWSLHNSRLIDTWLLRIRDRPLPTKVRREEKRTKGAIVLKPPIGLHENVALIDVKTMHPINIIAFNLSPETKDPNGSIVVGPLEDGTVLRFRRSPEGLLPRAIRMTYEERERLRAKLKTLPRDSEEYARTKQLETLYKFLTCSYFGVTGFENFRLFDIDVKRAILFLARQTLLTCKKAVEAHGYEVVYGDTDSLFVKLRSSHPGEGRIIEKIVNDALMSFALRHRARYIPEAKYEAFFKTIIFKPKTGQLEAAKKRYAGITSDGHLIVVGLEPRRSSTAAITRRVMLEFLEIILRERDIKKAVELLRTTYNELPKYPICDVAIPKGLHKTEYKSRNPWQVGCQYMQEHFGIRFREDKKPRLVYMIPELIEGKPPTDVVCVTEDMQELPKELRNAVDWDKMRERVIKRTFEPLLKALGYDWKFLETGLKQESLLKWT